MTDSDDLIARELDRIKQIKILCNDLDANIDKMDQIRSEHQKVLMESGAKIVLAKKLLNQFKWRYCRLSASKTTFCLTSDQDLVKTDVVNELYNLLGINWDHDERTLKWNGQKSIIKFHCVDWEYFIKGNSDEELIQFIKEEDIGVDVSGLEILKADAIKTAETIDRLISDFRSKTSGE